jgi:excisionase family DNA binding protein
MDEALLVSKRSAAAMLGVSVRTLENLIRLKELPARRIGRRCLVERHTLERFVRRDHTTKAKVKPFDQDNSEFGVGPRSSDGVGSQRTSGEVLIPPSLSSAKVDDNEKAEVNSAKRKNRTRVSTGHGNESPL